MRKLKISANGETAVFFLWRLLFLTNLSCKDDEVGERRSHCKLAWCWPTWVAKMMKLEGDDRTASWLDVDQPAAGCSPSRHCIASHYQGDATSPHWVKKPHQELTPAIMTMFVAGSSWEYWEKLPCCETLHSPPYGNFSDFHTVLSSGRVKTCQI